MLKTGFHVHIDATELDPEVERFFVDEHGFENTDFCGHPPGLPHFEPDHHLTRKCADSATYRRLFAQTIDILSKTNMRGYVEGECVSSDVDLLAAPFVPNVTPGFRLTLARLPQGHFRASEIHVTMNRDRSEPRLVEALCQAGFFAAYLPKSYGTAVVLTAQGSRAMIDALLPRVHAFVLRAGGAVSCSVMEERVVGWWLSHADVELPPVVAAVTNLDA
jgi:hypothetical protein